MITKCEDRELSKYFLKCCMVYVELLRPMIVIDKSG